MSTGGHVPRSQPGSVGNSSNSIQKLSDTAHFSMSVFLADLAISRLVEFDLHPILKDRGVVRDATFGHVVESGAAYVMHLGVAVSATT